MAQQEATTETPTGSAAAVPVAMVTSVVESPLAAASAASDAAFSKYDSDRSGTLTKEECMDFIAGVELSLSREYVEGAWSVYDTNGDGVLNRCENSLFAQSAVSETR